MREEHGVLQLDHQPRQLVRVVAHQLRHGLLLRVGRRVAVGQQAQVHLADLDHQVVHLEEPALLAPPVERLQRAVVQRVPAPVCVPRQQVRVDLPLDLQQQVVRVVQQERSAGTRLQPLQHQPLSPLLLRVRLRREHQRVLVAAPPPARRVVPLALALAPLLALLPHALQALLLRRLHVLRRAALPALARRWLLRVGQHELVVLALAPRLLLAEGRAVVVAALVRHAAALEPARMVEAVDEEVLLHQHLLHRHAAVPDLVVPEHLQLVLQRAGRVHAAAAARTAAGHHATLAPAQLADQRAALLAQVRDVHAVPRQLRVGAQAVVRAVVSHQEWLL